MYSETAAGLCDMFYRAVIFAPDGVYASGQLLNMIEVV
jgi:hypothetical protein